MLISITINSPDVQKRFPHLKSWELKFEPGVNLIIGPNGSGKSTVVQQLTYSKKYGRDNKDSVITTSAPINFASFDFERDNPRKKHYVDTIWDVQCHFMSHGEVNHKLIHTMSRLDHDGLVIVDEPEQALDVTNQLFLSKQLAKFKQAVVATHSPILMWALPDAHRIELKSKYESNMLADIDKIRKKYNGDM
jgi:predicted ATPase